MKEFIVKPHVLSQRDEYRVSWGLLDQRQWSFYYSHIINFINTGRLYIKRNYRDRWTTDDDEQIALLVVVYFDGVCR